MHYLRKIIECYLPQLLAIGVGLCLAVAALGTNKYSPDADFLGSCLGISILSIVLFVCFLAIKKIGVGLSTVTWCAFFVIIGLQVAYQNINYLDSLIFPAATMFIAVQLSVIIQSFDSERKEIFVKYLCVIISMVAVALFFTQLGQTIVPGYYSFINGTETLRPPGNTSQPNQTAFILSVGVSSVLYLSRVLKYISIATVSILVVMLSCGIGISSSRGGIILLSFAVLMWSISILCAKKKSSFLHIGIILFSAIIGIKIGVYVTQLFLETDIVLRVHTGAIAPRVSLLEQSWLLFSNNVITGVGWGNFGFASLDYFEDIEWFANAVHAHSVIPHIAAELGLIGLLALLPISLTIIKNIKNIVSDSHEKRVAMHIIVLTILYSFSEYPLWYSFYLFIFVSFVALLDNKIELNVRIIKPITSIILLLIFGASFYYYRAFHSYADTYSLINSVKDRNTQKQIYIDQEKYFGLSYFNESILYMLLPISNQNLERDLAIGYRVVSKGYEDNRLGRLATFEALNGNKNKSLKLFQAACLFGGLSDCNEVTLSLEDLQNQQPKKFIDINNEYKDWLKKIEK